MCGVSSLNPVMYGGGGSTDLLRGGSGPSRNLAYLAGQQTLDERGAAPAHCLGGKSGRGGRGGHTRPTLPGAQQC